ncbi:MAG: hypothetical protein HYS17_04335 [Micavibrio aeruginosavorus]|uniref:HAD family hydrolase n=1 Tax=Micavibrio aeruginosavorus TaxID=349221 RepID=A0A7T5R3X2_9BACT|nr:MAG: hypothetical protein HYS17_04335 [Micavibrio aeruginosavorus]
MLYFIHDLDDNLQKFHPHAVDAMHAAAACAVIEDCGLTLTVDEVKKLIEESVRTKNSHFDLLIEQHGADWRTLHLGYNLRMDRGIVKPIAHLPACMAQFNGHAEHSILSHSHMAWASDCVDINGIRPWIPDERIITLEMYHTEPKHKGFKGFELALQSMGGPDPKNVIFTDDTAANHVMAKKMGMQTVWSSHGRTLAAEFASSVDHIVDDVTVFMQNLAQHMGLPAVKTQGRAPSLAPDS